MGHTASDKTKLLKRVGRIRGQLNAVESALERDDDCSAVLQTLAACRGALNGLMSEIIEGHIRFHIVDPARRPTSEQARATQELLDVLRAYLK
jgi:DNA-binding FrmR family transcriptional regulator